MSVFSATMSKLRGSNGWRDDLAYMVEGTDIRFAADPIRLTSPVVGPIRSGSTATDLRKNESDGSESLKEQVKGYAVAWAEILLEFCRGCKDILQQSLITEDSYIAKKFGGPCAKVSDRLKFMNELLPEDRDPVYAWPLIFFIIVLAFAAMNVNTTDIRSVRAVKKVLIHPPSANLILLPDRRNLAYHERGVAADQARFSIIAPHSFFSSRLAGMAGVKTSLLEDFGVRLITYDLPGFGESEPHPSRNLNSSAFDMLHLADAVGVHGKFWVLGYSDGANHAWAALRYIPDRIAGAIMVSPMINPYEPSMTKEEMKETWEKWTPRRKLMYILARKFPKLLSYLFHQTIFSERHDRVDKSLSLSLGKRDEALIQEKLFEDFWCRNVEESIRQRNVKPFIEEAVLQVSHWGFSLSDLRLQKKCNRKGILAWLRSMYSQAECESAGFSGPIHIWQGMDDQVTPPAMTNYISRVLPQAFVHRLPNEGHFSFFCFCDECHRQVFSSLFGTSKLKMEASPSERVRED